VATLAADLSGVELLYGERQFLEQIGAADGRDELAGPDELGESLVVTALLRGDQERLALLDEGGQQRAA
jgi:hypothetical protein